eukprot:gene19421-23255_t
MSANQTLVFCPNGTKDLLAKSVPCLKSASLTVRASTEYAADYGVQHCTLDFIHPRTGSSAWCAGANDANQFIVASCPEPRMFTGVATQGRYDADQWVTSYMIRFTLDNVTWYDFMGGNKIAANSDRNTAVAHKFDPPICARSIAIHPLTWSGHVSMRCEFFAAPVETHPKIQMGTVFIGNRDLNGVFPVSTAARSAVKQVKFKETFMFAPMVSCGLTLIDANSMSNPCYTSRISVVVTNISTTGFTCTFNTWSDSNVYDLQADYVAVDSGAVSAPKLKENTVSTVYP